MYNDLFAELGLSKNEARIYEILLKHGELSAGAIAEKTLIHRRNVYDTLSRLQEKGLVFEVLESKESIFRAVDPDKLMDLLNEKGDKLTLALPALRKLYVDNPDEDRVALYRGIEGWKTYLRDMLTVAKEVRIIGATGASLNPKLGSAFEQFKREANRKKLNIRALYRPDAGSVIGHLGEISENRVLPSDDKHNFPASCAIYGSHVVIFSRTGKVADLPEEITMTFIVNQQIADTFRSWFDLAWESSDQKHRK